MGGQEVLVGQGDGCPGPVSWLPHFLPGGAARGAVEQCGVRRPTPYTWPVGLAVRLPLPCPTRVLGGDGPSPVLPKLCQVREATLGPQQLLGRGSGQKGNSEGFKSCAAFQKTSRN